MLVKIFEVDETVRSEELTAEIIEAIASLGFVEEQIRIVYSDLCLRKGVSAIRVLSTGTDVCGYERKVTTAVGNSCLAHYGKQGLEFPGLSNPFLPNQK